MNLCTEAQFEKAKNNMSLCMSFFSAVYTQVMCYDECFKTVSALKEQKPF